MRSRLTPSAPPLHFDHEAGLAAVADVRLDDREGLRGALGLRRCNGAGLADGERVLRALRRWAGDLPKHLFGDYAFALRDARKRVLFCARDPMGVKLCYYSYSTFTPPPSTGRG